MLSRAASLKATLFPTIPFAAEQADASRLP